MAIAAAQLVMLGRRPFKTAIQNIIPIIAAQNVTAAATKQSIVAIAPFGIIGDGTRQKILHMEYIIAPRARKMHRSKGTYKNIIQMCSNDLVDIANIGHGVAKADLTFVNRNGFDPQLWIIFQNANCAGHIYGDRRIDGSEINGIIPITPINFINAVAGHECIVMGHLIKRVLGAGQVIIAVMPINRSLEPVPIQDGFNVAAVNLFQIIAV